MSDRTMRAKLSVTSIQQFHSGEGEQRKLTQETVSFAAVGPKGSYPDDGSDENNTYAKWTPTANASFGILNPALFGQFKPGDEFYVDFTPAPQ